MIFNYLSPIQRYKIRVWAILLGSLAVLRYSWPIIARSLIVSSQLVETRAQVLILRGLTMSLEGVEVELVLVRSTTYAPFIRNTLVHIVSWFFNKVGIVQTLVYILSGIVVPLAFSEVRLLSHAHRRILPRVLLDYLRVPSGLWSALYLVLDLLLIFVGFPDVLLVCGLRSIKGMHLMMRMH